MTIIVNNMDYQKEIENMTEEKKIELRKHFAKYSTLSEKSRYRALYYLSLTL